jgi:hypothetical protein
MGIDAEIYIKFEEEQSERQLGNLKYHLLNRFKDILWWEKDDTEHLLREEGGLDYEIGLMVRYYSLSYPRGPGLKLGALIIFLNRYPGIKEVVYGGDSKFVHKADEQFGFDLINDWINYSNVDGINTDDGRGPICDHCLTKTSVCGGGPRVTFYRCRGCGKSCDVYDDLTRKWRA